MVQLKNGSIYSFRSAPVPHDVFKTLYWSIIDIKKAVYIYGIQSDDFREKYAADPWTV